MVLWLKYEPQELVDTSNLSSEEWLSYRRRGIGGSDAAAILGISPWRTARDLYYDKLNVVKADMDENWVALEMGHLLEDLVARIFAKKTGLRIFQRKVMFPRKLVVQRRGDRSGVLRISGSALYVSHESGQGLLLLPVWKQ